jgi:hypothetical protein
VKQIETINPVSVSLIIMKAMGKEENGLLGRLVMKRSMLVVAVIGVAVAGILGTAQNAQARWRVDVGIGFPGYYERPYAYYPAPTYYYY